MKAKVALTITTLLLSSGLAFAAGQSKDHKAHHPDQSGDTALGASAMSDGGMGMMQDMHGGKTMNKQGGMMAGGSKDGMMGDKMAESQDKMMEQHMDMMQSQDAGERTHKSRDD